MLESTLASEVVTHEFEWGSITVVYRPVEYFLDGPLYYLGQQGPLQGGTP